MSTQHLTSTTSFCELFQDSELCPDEIFAILQSLDDNSSNNIFSLATVDTKDNNGTCHENKKRKKPAKNTSSSSSSLRLCSDEDSVKVHAVLSTRKSIKRQKGSLSLPATSIENGSGEEGARVSHISVERNRRKQMNEHLALLRQLMPSFYVKKGDQTSIVGGVINYINELHHVLESLEAKKQRKIYSSEVSPIPKAPRSLSMIHSSSIPSSTSSIANVEVKFCGPNLEVKTLSSKIAGHVVKIVSVVEGLSLEILQLSIDTVEEAMLNTFIIKIGIDCRISAEELADKIQQTFC